jgi:hypothetical protein
VGSPGAPQIIKGNFTYSNCLRSASESCTVTEKSGPTEIKVLKEGHETGKVTGKGEVQVKCGSFINCTYDGEGLEASAKGSLLSTETNGSVSLNEQVTHKVSGFICPGEAKLDITTTPLVAIYIRAGELGEKMVCIFVGTNNGFYLNASGTTCETQNKTRVGSYELAFATTGTAKTHVCAFVANGFYLSANNGGTCEAQDETRVGSYELGITQ